MDKKKWNIPEICQLGIESTEQGFLQSENVDKEWLNEGIKTRTYS